MIQKNGYLNIFLLTARLFLIVTRPTSPNKVVRFTYNNNQSFIFSFSKLLDRVIKRLRACTNYVIISRPYQKCFGIIPNNVLYPRESFYHYLHIAFYCICFLSRSRGSRRVHFKWVNSFQNTLFNIIYSYECSIVYYYWENRIIDFQDDFYMVK